MIKYIPESQLSIEEFKTPFEKSLSPDNRWVELSKIVPWDHFASIYIQLMNSNIGRPGLFPRMILGALIIKHKQKLDDRGVILAIQENIYMQYFVGLKGFSVEPVFDASLFVEIRKRIGASVFDQLNLDLIKSASQEADQNHLSKKSKDKKDGDEPSAPNKGKLQMDATVADQYITFPTDSKLLNSGRKQAEKMLDSLFKLNGGTDIKPRTYRHVLHKYFLNYSKKRNQSKASHRKMNRKLLEALERNLKHIDNFLDQFEKQKMHFPFRGATQKNALGTSYPLWATKRNV
jgi:IS5 family transposase